MSEHRCGACDLLSRYAKGEKDLNIVYELEKVVYESEHTLAYFPKKHYAPVGISILSKKHIPTIFDLTEQDNELIIDVMNAIKAAAAEIITLKGGCKLEMYLGEFQNTKHFHCHVIYDPSID